VFALSAAAGSIHGDLHTKNVCIRRRKGLLVYQVGKYNWNIKCEYVLICFFIKYLYLYYMSRFLFVFFIFFLTNSYRWFATVIDFGRAGRLAHPDVYAMADFTGLLSSIHKSVSKPSNTRHLAGFNAFIKSCATISVPLNVLLLPYFNDFSCAKIMETNKEIVNYFYDAKHSSTINPPSSSHSNLQLHPLPPLPTTLTAISNISSPTTSPTITTTTSSTYVAQPTPKQPPTIISLVEKPKPVAFDPFALTPYEIARKYALPLVFTSWEQHNMYLSLPGPDYNAVPAVNSGKVCLVCQDAPILPNRVPACHSCHIQYEGLVSCGPVCLKYTFEKGWGVYAKRPIAKGEYITFYGGHYFEGGTRPTGEHIYQVNKNTYLDGKPTDTFTVAVMLITNQVGSLCNTGRGEKANNNAQLVTSNAHHRVKVQARVAIAANEEIFVPYGGQFILSPDTSDLELDPSPVSPVQAAKKARLMGKTMREVYKKEKY
jgi:hypothetical protein